ncbi:hypothetical protein LCGC14_2794050 [marine sediment metagenome]|uniref:Uncharacterized protein n=1 Tax=marine sediment metagenome TaxID=412755 RepID=A0A0F8YPT5_9ZZZZ
MGWKMPKILELKEIDCELWARIGTVGDFPSGIALWTPDEQRRVKWLATRDEREECAKLVEIVALDGCAEFRARVASEIRARKEEKET